MEFIDTHAHLYSEEFDNDRNDIILKAKNEGYLKMYDQMVAKADALEQQSKTETDI